MILTEPPSVHKIVIYTKIINTNKIKLCVVLYHMQFFYYTQLTANYSMNYNLLVWWSIVITTFVGVEGFIYVGIGDIF